MIRPRWCVFIAPLLLLSLAIFGWGEVSAASIPVTTTELVQLSSNIVRGEVVSQRSYWNDDKNFIFTIATLRVNSQLKGSVDSAAELEIWLPGGEIDNTGLAVEHAASFDVGQDVIVFLTSNNGLLDVTGWEQGKYTIEDNRVIENNMAVAEFEAEIARAQR